MKKSIQIINVQFHELSQSKHIHIYSTQIKKLEFHSVNEWSGEN